MATTTGDSGPTLSFGLLGPLQVSRDGELLSLGGRQQRAVLAYLLTQPGRVTSLERLADAIWGDEPPTGSSATLHTYVFHLREVLEPEHRRGEAWHVLLTESGGYRLEIGASEVDATAFEQAVEVGRAALAASSYDEAAAAVNEALGLWRGAVLADLADLPCVEPIATRLTDLRLFAVELHAEIELALGRHASVLSDLGRTLDEHPLREQLHAQRILALYRSGRQSDALAAYRVLHSLLDAELGVEPSPPLRALHQAVLTQDPALDWHAPPVPAGPATAPADPATVTGTAPSPTQRPTHRPSRRPSRRARLAAAGVAVVTVGALIAVLATRSPGPSELALRSNAVGFLDGNGALGPSVPVGNGPDGITYGDHLLWVANQADNSVTAVDPTTGQPVQRRISVGRGPVALAVSGHDLWVANADDGTVARVSTTTYGLLGSVAVGARPAAIAAGPTGVWVANYGDDTIRRIDPVSGTVDDPIPVDHGPTAIAVDEHSVWVAATLHDTVQEYVIDQVGPSGRTTLRRGHEIASPSGPKDIALTPTDVWVANSLSKNVTRFVRATGETKTYPVGEGPHSIQVSGGQVWVSNELAGSVTRLDPKTGRSRTIGVGSSPRGLAAVQGKVWVTTGAFSESRHRGGTVTIADAVVPGDFSAGSIDPAKEYDLTTSTAERWVYDGLVSFRAAAGLAAQSLVADLAEQIPPATDNGLTYRFMLRRKPIYYNTGQRVLASDFARGLQRALTVESGGEGLLANIVGAQACIDHRSTCDLSEGIRTDDVQGTVTLRLIRPDAGFPARLSLHVFPVPPGTSVTESRAPVPGTGPYQIVTYEPGVSMTLARNPHFAQWSFAAQPTAYPDEIIWQKADSPTDAARAVTEGRADLADLIGAPARELDRLYQQHPGRLFVNTLDQTSFAFLDSKRPPFNKLEARQALNYAVDRRELVRLQGGDRASQLTCQVLPPNFPSWRRYCHYTVRPTIDGLYHGPDLRLAQQLVTQSGTRGMSVTVRGTGDEHSRPLDGYLRQVLRTLGYDVRVEEIGGQAFYDAPLAQVTTTLGWVADYPAAANFFDGVFACRAEGFRGDWYCNPAINRAIRAAHTAEESSAVEASRLWTALDQTITDSAIVIPTGNLTKPILVSARVGNFQTSAPNGPLLSQMWVN